MKVIYLIRKTFLMEGSSKSAKPSIRKVNIIAENRWEMIIPVFFHRGYV
jgi:hypothetical protein